MSEASPCSPHQLKPPFLSNNYLIVIRRTKSKTSAVEGLSAPPLLAARLLSGAQSQVFQKRVLRHVPKMRGPKRGSF